MRIASSLLAALIASGCVSNKAIEKAELSVLRDPNQVEAWVVLGDTYRRARRVDEATVAYQGALVLASDNEEVLRRLGAFRGLEIREMEREALAAPTDDEIWGDLGDLYAEVGDRETAFRIYRYALTLDPGDGEWIRKVMEFGGPEDLQGIIASILEGQDDEAIGDLADGLRDRGLEVEACRLYERALEIDPNDSEWIRKFGACPGGRAFMEQILDAAIASGDDERIGDVADILMDQGDVDGACALYARALEIDPDDTEWLDRTASCRWGGDFEPYEGREPPFDGELGHLESMFGEGASDDLDQAHAALAAGDRATALQHFEAALEAAPLDRQARVGVLALGGRSLVVVLEELVTVHPDDDEVWGDLGDARLEAGDAEGALQAYRRAASIDPEDAEWQGKLDLLDPDRPGSPRR